MKHKNNNNHADEEEENDDLVDMPIAKALLNNDTTALTELLQNHVFKHANIQSTTIQQTIGHAYTGGRSTPVYRITCTIERPKDGILKEKYMIAKLVRNMSSEDMKRKESYAVERRFYDHPECAEYIRQQNLTMPKLLLGDKDGKFPHSTVCWIMNDLSKSGLFPIQVQTLSLKQAKAALSWIAAFHALQWNNHHVSIWKQDILHSRGGYWTTKSSTAPTQECKNLSTQWKQAFDKIKESQLTKDEYNRLVQLGSRIQNVCQYIGIFLFQQTQIYGTWIHGDYKAANILFKQELENQQQREEVDNNDDDADLSSFVAVVDFQFIGWGLCSEDVAYLLYPDANGSLMDHIDELLQFYHEQLIDQMILQMKGGPSSIPFHVFERLYDLCLIDLTRYWLCKGWQATMPGEIQILMRIEKAIDAIDGGNYQLSSQEAYLDALDSYLLAPQSA